MKKIDIAKNGSQLPFLELTQGREQIILTKDQVVTLSKAMIVLLDKDRRAR